MGINVQPDDLADVPDRRGPGGRGRADLRALPDQHLVLPGIQAGLIAFTAAVMGGIGNIAGAVLGG